MTSWPSELSFPPYSLRGEEEADTRVPGGFHIHWPPRSVARRDAVAAASSKRRERFRTALRSPLAPRLRPGPAHSPTDLDLRRGRPGCLPATLAQRRPV